MSRLHLTRWLLGHTRRLLGPLLISVLARIANQVLGVALLVLTAMAFDAAAARYFLVSGAPLTGWDGSQTAVLVAWLVVIALVKAGLRYLEHYTGHWVAFTALQRLRELFYARLAPQAPAATTGRAGAELTERATRDIDRVEVFFAHTFPPAVSAVIVPGLWLTWLGVTVNATLAWVIAPFVACMLLAPVWSGRRTWSAARTIAEARGRIAAQVGDDVQGIREVLAFGAQQQRLAVLDDAGRQLTRARDIAGTVQGQRAATVVLLHLFTLIATVAVASGSGIPPATTAIALAVAIGLWVPARGIEGFTAGLDAAFAAAGRLREIIEAEPLVQDRHAAAELPHGSELQLDDVTVRYPGSDRPALREISACFEQGKWSVVVGVSGSGKSTLASLLVRGLDPESGTVRLGGTDVRELRLNELRARVGFVSQRPTVLSGTIADALRLAAPDAAEDTLRAALRLVVLEDWGDGLPRGLRTPVRERGLSLSGGELQRLALARALVAEPGVLVLDEALSQLDAATARTVRARLAEQRPGLTIVEISHRADLIPDDTPVVVLDKGRLVQAGTAGWLRQSGGEFTRLEARN